MDSSAIARACELSGGQSSLARKLGVQPPTVNEWVSRGRAVPEARCPDIERVTAGKVTCEELRDDITWHRVRDTKWPWHPAGRPLIDVSRSAEKKVVA